MLLVGIGKDEIPSVEAVLAAIRDDVTGIPAPVFARVREQKTATAAIHAHDLSLGVEIVGHLGSLPEELLTTMTAVRVVAGTLRGRAIEAPPGTATRPTTDRTREAMFNALVSLGAVQDAVVLDVFAGSGALGIEALSRGATMCTFVEQDSKAVEVIRRNLRVLGLVDRSSVVAARVETALASIRNQDLVLVDPPYRYDGEQWLVLIDALDRVIGDSGVVVLESGSSLDHILEQRNQWEVVRSRKYGRTWVTFLRRNEPEPVR